MIESRSIRNQTRSLPKSKGSSQLASRISVEPRVENKTSPKNLKTRRLKALEPTEKTQDINFVALSSGLGFQAEASLSNNEFKSRADSVSSEDHERIISKKLTHRPKELSLTDAFSRLKDFSSSKEEGPVFENVLNQEESLISFEPVEWEPARRTERFNAFILDSILVMSVTVLFFLLGLSVGSGPGMSEAWTKLQGATSWMWIKVFLMGLSFVSALFFIYFTACESFIGRSLGKWAFNLNVMNSSSGGKSGLFRILLRNITFALGLFTGGLGLFWTFLDSRRRCWHDIVSSTEVCVPVYESEITSEVEKSEELFTDSFQAPNPFA